MMKSPWSVKTAFAFIVLQVVGALIGVASTFNSRGEDSFANSFFSLEVRRGFAAVHVLILCSILFLIAKGKHAARVAYALWGAVAMIYLLVLVDFRVLAVLPPIGFYLAIVALLFIPASNPHFKK
jgi:hypothetical protein